MEYSPLPILRNVGSIDICRPRQDDTRVSRSSSALETMTDFKQVGAAVISPQDTLEQAESFMIRRGVRLLLVLDDLQRLVGIITAADILGEKPIALAQEHRVRHSDMLVADIMTPANQLEVLDLAAVKSARVGQIIATLERARRQHALVVQVEEPDRHVVRGIFSLTQIARQLGVPLELPAQAPSFAELEATLAAA